jgi:hypothetical protein
MAFSGSAEERLSHRNANTAPGAMPMRVDLQKVDAEITALRSKLAAINDNFDECRRVF